MNTSAFRARVSSGALKTKIAPAAEFAEAATQTPAWALAETQTRGQPYNPFAGGFKAAFSLPEMEVLPGGLGLFDSFFSRRSRESLSSATAWLKLTKSMVFRLHFSSLSFRRGDVKSNLETV